MEQDANIMIVLAGASAKLSQRHRAGSDGTLLHSFTPTLLHFYTSTCAYAGVGRLQTLPTRKVENLLYTIVGVSGGGEACWWAALALGQCRPPRAFHCCGPVFPSSAATDSRVADEGCAQKRRCVRKTRPSTVKISRVG